MMDADKIIKTLECDTHIGCEDCPHFHKDCNGFVDDEATAKDILDFINHLKAENASLKSDVAILTDANNNLVELCKKEKERSEKLKGKMINLYKRMKEGG